MEKGVETVPHIKGRPTRVLTNNWKKALRPLFTRGISVVMAHELVQPTLEQKLLPIPSIKTVKIYWHDWAEELTTQTESDFAEREQAERNQAIMAIEKQLNILHTVQTDLENTIIQKKKEYNLIHESNGNLKLGISSFLLEERRAIITSITDLLKLRLEIISSPTLTDRIKAEVAKKIQTELKH